MKTNKYLSKEFLTKLAMLSTELQYLLKTMKWISKNSKLTLHFLSGINRGVTGNHVTTIAGSLMFMGNLRPIIIAKLSFITGKAQHYIIEGQHIYTALLRLGWDIPYVVIEIKDKKQLIETIALLNASSNSWTTKDYVNSWSCLNEDYVKLNQYELIYDIEMSLIASILNEESLTSGYRIGAKIKSGEFYIKNEKENVKILDDLTDVLKVIPRMNRYENRYACSEYVNFRTIFAKEYNHNKFMKSLYLNKQKFILATQEKSKLADMFRVLAK